MRVGDMLGTGAGKGDKYRSVDIGRFRSNWEICFGNTTTTQQGGGSADTSSSAVPLDPTIDIMPQEPR